MTAALARGPPLVEQTRGWAPAAGQLAEQQREACWRTNCGLAGAAKTRLILMHAGQCLTGGRERCCVWLSSWESYRGS
jgi:hypothetical protein